MSDQHGSKQWYWAASSAGSEQSTTALAGHRFVVAMGQRELWHRIRNEVDAQERPAWMGFGPASGVASLSDCLTVFILAVHVYGVSFNRAMLEMAKVPAWATYVREAPTDLCNLVSNPISYDPLPREPYDREVEEQLRRRLQATLGPDRSP